MGGFALIQEEEQTKGKDEKKPEKTGTETPEVNQGRAKDAAKRKKTGTRRKKEGQKGGKKGKRKREASKEGEKDAQKGAKRALRSAVKSAVKIRGDEIANALVTRTKEGDRKSMELLLSLMDSSNHEDGEGDSGHWLGRAELLASEPQWEGEETEENAENGMGGREPEGDGS